jgi:myosin heavy subunit
MSVRLQKATVATKHVWVADSETGDWNLCKVIGQDNSMMTLQNVTTGARFSYDTAFGEVFQANDGVYPDMTYLRHLHEAAILHNLRERLLAREPYTFMGSVLISVNPFEWLENPNPAIFAGKSMDSDKPHPFAIAGNFFLSAPCFPYPSLPL